MTVYKDGDQEFELQSWQQAMIGQEQQSSMKDPLMEHVKDHFFEENEVGLKHPVKDAIVKITDDGYIDLFAGPALGIRIDPITKSVNIFGETVNLFGKKFNMKTQPNGFIWNNYYFNPQLYYENENEKDQRISGTKMYQRHSHEGGHGWHEHDWSIRPMIRVQERTQYSEGMIKIMKEMGLPVE